MKNSDQTDYPKIVYDNAWEGLGVMYENWKAVHGIDRQFCIEINLKFANYLDTDKQTSATSL